ncbi:MAG: hypothetical protein RML85_10130 [Acidobacteriota bacterium]|nr:hypothetical protein [Acidobacteriota bacterium]
MKSAPGFRGDVRGLGAMVAVELVLDCERKVLAPSLTREILEGCYTKGLILSSAERLVPLRAVDHRRGAEHSLLLEEALAEVEALASVKE